MYATCLSYFYLSGMQPPVLHGTAHPHLPWHCGYTLSYLRGSQTFRWSGGISGLQEGEDETTITTIELDRAAGDTVGIYLSQGDGFDKHEGVFVSRVDMGSTAESMGLKVGHEVLAERCRDW